MIDQENVYANYKPSRRRKRIEFNLERLLAACVHNKLVDEDGEVCPRRLHARLTERMLGEGLAPATLRSVQRVLNGDTDPLHGSAGRRPLIFSLAPALGYTVDWMTTQGKRRRS